MLDNSEGTRCLTKSEFNNAENTSAVHKPLDYFGKGFYKHPDRYCNSSTLLDLSIVNRDFGKITLYFIISSKSHMLII